MKIVVLDGYTLNPGDNPWTEVELLGDLIVHDRTPEERIVDRAAEADIILTNKTPLSAATLQQLPNVRFISVLATGHNIVDADAAQTHGVPVSNVPEYGTQSVAQYVLAAILNFARQNALHDRLVHEGRWQSGPDFCFWETPLTELTGKRIGVVGFGRIGRSVGQLAHAFGMEVMAFDVHQTQAPDYEPFAWTPIEELFAQSDYVTLHCPLTAENTGMVNQQLLQRMKPRAVLINTSRGGLVHERDLADALDQERISGAAVDVLSTEPPSDDNPLLSAKNCVITPHIAWATIEARRRMMAVTAKNLRAFIEGKPINVVNRG